MQTNPLSRCLLAALLAVVGCGAPEDTLPPESGVAVERLAMEDGLVNVTLNKPVSASTSDGAYLPALAVDGDLTTRASRWLAAPGTGPRYLDVDLQGTSYRAARPMNTR